MSRSVRTLIAACAGLAVAVGAFAEPIVYYEPHTGYTETFDSESPPAKFQNPSGPPQVVVGGGKAGNATWNLTFTDVTSDNDIGFDDPTLGELRQATAGAVLSYINSALNTAPAAAIDVTFNASQTDGTGFLGSAGTFYTLSNGFTGGSTQIHLTTGVDPFGGTPDITVTMDFGYPWNSDLGAPTGGEYDLFSVLLHEFTHGLGFAGLITATGVSSIDGTDPGSFSLFSEKFERIGTATAMFSAGGNYVGSIADLTSDDVGFAGTNAEAANGGSPADVYAPGTFASGSSLSHLDFSVFPGAVMKHFSSIGSSIRSYSTIELAILEDIGFASVDAVTAPYVLTVLRDDTNPTSATSVDYTVTFSESVSGVDTADFSLTTTGVSGASVTGVSGSGTTYTVTVGTGTLSGTIRLDVDDDDTIVDGSAEPLGDTGAGNGDYSLGQVYSVVKIPPAVSSIVRADSDPNGSASVDFTVTFNKSVSGVDTTDFTPSTTGVSGAGVTGVSGSGASYTVTVSTGTGNGTIRLDVVDDDTIVDTTPEPLGGAGAGNGNFSSGQTYTIDKTGPTPVLSSAAGDPVSGAITVSVNTGESTTNFVSGDITPTNASVSGFSGSGSSYSFTLTPTSAGLFSAQVNASMYTDSASNANNASNVLSRTFDNTAPPASLSSGAPNPTNAGIGITVDTGESTTNFVVGDISTTNGSVTGFSGSGSSYSFTLNALGQGTVSAQINAGAYTDTAGNGNTASNVISRTFDSLGPVPSFTLPDPNPTNADSVDVDIMFNEDPAGSFSLADITAIGTLATGAGIGLSGSGTTYTVTLTPADADADGTLGISIGTGVTDGLGNASITANSPTYLITDVPLPVRAWPIAIVLLIVGMLTARVMWVRSAKTRA